MPTLETDAACVAAAIKGDRAAFSELVRRHQGVVYRIVLRIVRDPAEANDAAQEAFLKAFRNLASFDATRAFAPWLYRIARNHALDMVRHEKASPEELEAPDPEDDEDAPGAVGRNVADPEAADALSMLETDEIKRRIGGALSTLDSKYREVIELYHFEQLTYDEIAQTLSVPIGTVMTRIHRGRAKLADALQMLRVA